MEVVPRGAKPLEDVALCPDLKANDVLDARA